MTAPAAVPPARPVRRRAAELSAGQSQAVDQPTSAVSQASTNERNNELAEVRRNFE